MSPAVEPLFVETPAQLSALLEQLAGATRVAIDFEGDGLFRYRSRVCTMQLKWDAQLAVVDTLAVWDPDALATFLGPDGPLKVLHDAAFDARLLWDHGVRLGNVFDTALSARLLGEPATGLSSLLLKRLRVQIQKDKQQSDWGRRPLDEDSLRYLYDDVRHLFALQESLTADVAEAGIAAELAVECAYMLSQACQPPPPDRPAWLRIKGGRKLPPIERAVLRELAELRERTARDWDVPAFRVAHDRQLLALARRRPTSLRALAETRGLLKGRAKGLSQAFLAAVARGVAAGDAPPAELSPDSERSPSPELRARRKQLEKALSTWRTQEGKRRGVDIQVVLPGHGLQDLVKSAPTTLAELRALPGLGDVRIDRYGDTWLEMLSRGDPTKEAP